MIEIQEEIMSENVVFKYKNILYATEPGYFPCAVRYVRSWYDSDFDFYDQDEHVIYTANRLEGLALVNMWNDDSVVYKYVAHFLPN